MLLASGQPAMARDNSSPSVQASTAAPSTSNTVGTPGASSGVTGISFTRVAPQVYEKLQQRDTNMEWKCLGVNMYDCDGERAEASAKVAEDMKAFFRGDAQQR